MSLRPFESKNQLRMKFSMIILAFLFGAVYAFSVEDKVVEADESLDLINKSEEERCESPTRVTTPKPKPIPLGAWCNKYQDACQCYGKNTFCGCGFMNLDNCICREGSFGVASRKLDCPNKDEWENEDTTGAPSTQLKSIPFAEACDINKDDCQCYGKRGTCGCSILGCLCTIGDMETEIKKLNCSNKEEWASEYETTESKSIQLGGECDTNKGACQCYGKRTYCDCTTGSCTCKEAIKGTLLFTGIAERKSNCENKEEWASEYDTTEEITEEESTDASLSVIPLNSAEG